MQVAGARYVEPLNCRVSGRARVGSICPCHGEPASVRGDPLTALPCEIAELPNLTRLDVDPV